MDFFKTYPHVHIFYKGVTPACKGSIWIAVGWSGSVNLRLKERGERV
jgi:hypothetical protein